MVRRNRIDFVVDEDIEEIVEEKIEKANTSPVCEIRMPADCVIETANRSISASRGVPVRIKRGDLVLMHGSNTGELRVVDALTGDEIRGWCSISANFEQILDLVKGENR